MSSEHIGYGYDEDEQRREAAFRHQAMLAATHIIGIDDRSATAPAYREPSVAIEAAETTEPVPAFLPREEKYIRDIFGEEALAIATATERATIAAACTAMHLHNNPMRKLKYDEYGERTERFFSDMDFDEIVRAAETDGRVTKANTEWSFYGNMRRTITGKFTQEQTRAVLAGIMNGEPVDLTAIVPRKPYTPQAEAAQQRHIAAELAIADMTDIDGDDSQDTVGEPTASKRTMLHRELFLRTRDPFVDAHHPPENWQENERFLLLFNVAVKSIIEMAAWEAGLGEPNANFIKSRLDLPVTALAEDSFTLHKPLAYLHTTMSRHPGRLANAQHDKRLQGMTQTLRLFIYEGMPLGKIIDKYDGNPRAGLLLKGGVAEILSESIRAAKVARSVDSKS